mmetsp:Transcript_43634/g.120753  ORF Transcript_43634/g.120753 Transcript_43634/m.120753 type:complete len:278 (+) Transcript_43634:119-952(+)
MAPVTVFASLARSFVPQTQASTSARIPSVSNPPAAASSAAHAATFLPAWSSGGTLGASVGVGGCVTVAATAVALAATRRRGRAHRVPVHSSCTGLPARHEESSSETVAASAPAEGRCGCCACGPKSSLGANVARRESAFLAGFAGFAGPAHSEIIETKVPGILDDYCLVCNKGGVIDCLNCKGTGQFKMLSFKEGAQQGLYQYVDCPDCNGAGEKPCPKCLGTGLGVRQMRGIFRKPAFRKLKGLLSNDARDVPKLQAEVKLALEQEAAEKAAAQTS